PSAQRYFIATWRPSMKPASPKPCWKALRNLAKVRGEPLLRKPMTGRVPSCAPIASGHMVTTPSTTQKIRLVTLSVARLRNREPLDRIIASEPASLTRAHYYGTTMLDAFQILSRLAAAIDI